MNGRRMARKSSRIMYIWKMGSLLCLRLFMIPGNPLKVSHGNLKCQFEQYNVHAIGTCTNCLELLISSVCEFWQARRCTRSLY